MPPRLAPYVFAFILSGMMTCVVTAIATLRSVGFEPGVAGLWMSSWLVSWMVAFPLIFVLGPAVRAFVARLTRPRL